MLKLILHDCAIFKFDQIADSLARRDNTQPQLLCRQLDQERLHGCILQPSFLWPRRILQWFESVENKQCASLPNEARKPLTFVPRRASRRVCIAEPSQRLLNEQVGRGNAT